MLKTFLVAVGLASAAFIASASAGPLPMAEETGANPLLTFVAGGCGPYGWRGPYGHCRDTPFYGRLPNGYYEGPPSWAGYRGPVGGLVCPPGYWTGPWGHCRDTPYHGRLPGGGYQY